MLSPGRAGHRHLPAARGRVGTLGSAPELSHWSLRAGAFAPGCDAVCPRGPCCGSVCVAKEELPGRHAMPCAGAHTARLCPPGQARGCPPWGPSGGPERGDGIGGRSWVQVEKGSGTLPSLRSSSLLLCRCGGVRAGVLGTHAEPRCSGRSPPPPRSPAVPALGRLGAGGVWLGGSKEAFKHHPCDRPGS